MAVLKFKIGHIKEEGKEWGREVSSITWTTFLSALT
jgi:hypothetical protein